MTEFESGYTDLIADIKKLLKKIYALYDFFSNDNQYIPQIPFHHNKLSAANSVIDSITDKKIALNEIETSEMKAGLDELKTLITDSKKFLTEMVIEIEKITGKKIRFRSEL